MGILEGVYLVGHNDAIEDVEAYLIDYRRAYAEDLFTPVKLAEYRGNKREENLVTRTSAHMGRFILDNAVRYIRQLAEEDET